MAASTVKNSAPSSWKLNFMFILIALIVLLVQPTSSLDSADIDELVANADQHQLDDYLHTETVLIDTLRHYIETLERKVKLIKRKALEIKAINDEALLDVHKYVNNPLNALTIIKRFTADWQDLLQYAGNTDSTKEIVQNLTVSRNSLRFPSESDFDAAAENLLRIQGIYRLEPQRLAVGEVNGIKLGSEMSWSDCLEIGRISVQNGDFMLAKFWMETALDTLPAAANDTQPPRSESEKARFEIMEALLSTEYDMGNHNIALEIAEKMLKLHPQDKRLLNARKIIESELEAKKSVKAKGRANIKAQQSKKSKVRSDKSVEESLIEEICRESANAYAKDTSFTPTTHNRIGGSNKQSRCAHENANLPQLLLQPLRVEYLSMEPYIVILHNVLRSKELEELEQFVDQPSDDETSHADALEDMKFTKLGQKKLKRFARRLQLATGHDSESFDAWQLDHWTFEDDVDTTEPLLPRATNSLANVMFNLKQPRLGGAIVFPQLELSVTLPQEALLYWTNLNEFREYDYRTTQHICPVIAGTQVAAFTKILAK